MRLQHGLIVREQSGYYWIETAAGDSVRCRLRGRLKEEAQSADIAAIGDRVMISIVEEDGTSETNGVIESVEERTSVISRAVRTEGKRGAGQAEREHVLIANAQQAFFVLAATHPTPNFRMIDRLIVSAEKADIPVTLVVNKIDLAEGHTVGWLTDIYSAMGYTVLHTSTLDGTGIDLLRERLKDSISVFTGQSGVGKTSLLNCVQPDLGRVVKAVSETSEEGMHTTRDSALIRLNGGGYLADTPGIRQMLPFDVEPDELDGYFRDIAAYVGQCRFNNCTHTNEPGCAVRKAVKEKKIARHRYENFLHLRDELRETYIVYDL